MLVRDRDEKSVNSRLMSLVEVGLLNLSSVFNFTTYARVLDVVSCDGRLKAVALLINA